MDVVGAGTCAGNGICKGNKERGTNGKPNIIQRNELCNSELHKFV